MDFPGVLNLRPLTREGDEGDRMSSDHGLYDRPAQLQSVLV
jgi:hypothetical protein